MTLKEEDWVRYIFRKNPIRSEENQKREEESKLDGCYVMKTNLKEESKEVIHDRYKDLAEVEYAFRTLETGHLAIRPLYLQKDSRTRGHLLVSLLGYSRGNTGYFRKNK